MRSSLLLLAVLAVLLPGTALAQSPPCYLVADAQVGGSGNDQLTRIDKFTGAETNIGRIQYADNTNSTRMEAIALSPGIDPVLYGVTNRASGNGANQLGIIDSTSGQFTPTSSVVGSGLGVQGNVDLDDIDGLAFDFTDGTLYGSDRTGGTGNTTPDRLLKINPETGAVVQDGFEILTLGLVEYVEIDPVTVFDNGANRTIADVDDINVDPTTGQLYAIANDGSGDGDRNLLITIDKTDGSTEIVGATGIGDIEGFTFDYRGTIYGSTGQNSDNSGERDRLYRIDKEDGEATEITPNRLAFRDYEAVACLLPVKQEVTGDAGWRMLSAPVAGLTIRDLLEQNLVQGYPDSYPEADAANLLIYDPAQGYVVPENGLDTELESGQGFIWYLYDEAFVDETVPLPFALQGAGLIPTEDVTIGTPDTEAGGYLLGNPYDVPFDLSDLNLEEQGFLPTVFVYNPATGEYEEVVEDPDSNNDLIAPWQGFFVCRDPDAADPGTSLTFAADGRENQSDATFFRVGAPGYPVVAAQSADEAAAPRALPLHLAAQDAGGAEIARNESARLVFRAGATAGWDRWDAPRLTPLARTYATLAFPTGDASAAAMWPLKAKASLPLDPDGVFEIPVAMQTTAEAAQYTVSWPQSAWQNIPDAWKLTLVDRATGEAVDLRQAERYTFEAASGEADDARFTMRVEASSAGSPQTPDAFTLRGSAPNPFSGQTTIRYDLPEAGPVRAVVFDALGRQVTVLADEVQRAGAGKEVVFDGSRLASGLYFVRIETEQGAATQKVTLVK